MVNKIDRELINPIDNIINDVVDKNLETYHKLNLTPNHLTTIGLVFALLGIYLFYKDYYVIGAVLFFIAYYFDCADGKYARKYNMTSKYGSLYDSFSDIFKFVLLFAVMYKKSFKKLKLIILPMIILTLLHDLYMQCTEKIYNKHESEAFKYVLFSDVSNMNCNEKLKYLKYFGSATLILFISLVMVFWPKL